MPLIPVRVCGFLLGLDVDHAWGRFPALLWCGCPLIEHRFYVFCGEFDPGSG